MDSVAGSLAEGLWDNSPSRHPGDVQARISFSLGAKMGQTLGAGQSQFSLSLLFKAVRVF